MINTFNFPKESEINALNRIKIKLGLNDGNKDELLTVLFDDASNLVCTYINSDVLPNKLSWMAEEIAIKRFRKIGAEGIKSKQIDVIRKDFDENILSEYIVTLDKYIKENSNKLRLF
jgi:hypothetical protein